MPGMHAAGDDAVPKGIRRDDASAARPKKKSSADATAERASACSWVCERETSARIIAIGEAARKARRQL